MSALRAVELSARYAGQSESAAALANINIELGAGERLLLVGPNGAGKSTFIRVFSGLMRATYGQALVDGQPAREARARVGVVSHATYLYDELTAFENLRLYAELYGVVDVEVRVSELLEQMGVRHLADVQVGRLSRGQQQRVTLARALLHDPPVLLLDEPDTGLDVVSLELLERLVTGGGRTVVLTTHNLTTGLRLATNVGVLSRGRLAFEPSAVTGLDTAALAALVEGLS